MNVFGLGLFICCLASILTILGLVIFSLGLTRGRLGLQLKVSIGIFKVYD